MDHDEAVAAFKQLYPTKFDESGVMTQPEPSIGSPAEIERLHTLAIDQVINPKSVSLPQVAEAVLPAADPVKYEYLIITDNVLWDAATITPGASRPGMLAAFEDLAAAKEARSIKARVVTITDIVSGYKRVP